MNRGMDGWAGGGTCVRGDGWTGRGGGVPGWGGGGNDGRVEEGSLSPS